VITAGRKPRRRIAGLMIASIAVAEELPLFTTSPGDYSELGELLTVVPVTRPQLPRGRRPAPDTRQEPRPAGRASRARSGRPAWPSPAIRAGSAAHITDSCKLRNGDCGASPLTNGVPESGFALKISSLQERNGSSKVSALMGET
jgi:hypothetical protein